ncbi:MAG TPA: undecaprenyldiphospho-muramoylpentapeptide beta-N-acetylglucosaminyltransferase [Planctomycetota bacterium]|nr:undecaprenyldiphospho-muramoylpentapeptide beta-N-acetylglucosaminyltransferase [Planctomycetota bacterium]
MSLGPRVLLAGGGTGGHIFPALALAEELAAAEPGSELLFAGAAGGLEARLVPEAGHRLELLPSVKASGLVAMARLPFSLTRAFWRARGLLRSFRPDAVVTLGGYASLAPGLAAWRLGVPLVVLEQNAIPGRVSRFLARFAAEVHVEFPESAGLFPDSQRVAATGNPVRRAILEAAGRRAGRQPGSGGRLNLLVIGGSLGARRLNELFAEAGPDLAPLAGSLRVVHLSGTDKFAEATARAAASPVETRVLAFEKDMGPLYAEADLVLSRAGATGLAEIAACGIPAVLVPFPFAKDNHQEANARSFERAGAATVLLEGSLTGARLAGEVRALLGAPARLAEMGARMRSMGRPGAGAAIARRVLEIAARRRA